MTCDESPAHRFHAGSSVIFFKVFVEKMLKKTEGFVQIDAWKFPCCSVFAFLQLGGTGLNQEKRQFIVYREGILGKRILKGKLHKRN